MRISLPFRILVAHLVLTLGAATAAVWLVRTSFNDYFAQWQASVSTLPPEQMLQGFGTEVARALLLRLENLPEVRDRDRDRITQGLDAVLKEIPSVETLLIIDRDGRIQYANPDKWVDLGFRKKRIDEFLSIEKPDRKVVPNGGEVRTELTIPIFEQPKAPQGDKRRLGTLVVWFRPDPTLIARLPSLQPPSIPPETFMVPLLLFAAAIVAGGLLLGLVTALPVRRLDRALAEFRARGFRGPLDAGKLGLDGDLASAVRTINEMGGRLEALDSRGREREALLDTLSQSLEEGMVAVDREGIPVAWNEAALRILGLHDGSDEPETRLGRALAEHGIPSSGGTHLRSSELEVARPGSDPLAVGVTEVPFESRPGEAGALVLLRDLSTLRKVEAHLLEAGRFAVLAHLAGSLAHEIRNPLHSIGLNAGVVEQYVDAPATESSRTAVTESLRTIQEETRRLTELLNNYLGMLRSSADTSSVDVRDLCRRVIQLLSYAALRSKVTIELEGEEDLPRVQGVPDRLQQAILNLVLNAIQAMPHGGTVSLRTHASGGVVRVTVADTGPGIPPGMEDSLFDARVTTKPGGSGLGLPLVRLIAESHGGSVWYRSNPGHGAQFTLVLPATSKAA